MKNTALQKSLGFFQRIEKIIAAVCFAFISILMIFDIVSREVFSHGFPWAQKLAVYLMIWGGFLGASLTSYQGGHLSPDVARKLWAPGVKKLFERLAYMLTALFCFLAFYYSFQYVFETYELEDKDIILKLPIWLVQAVIPYVFLSMGIRNTFYALIEDLRPISKGYHQEESK